MSHPELELRSIDGQVIFPGLDTVIQNMQGCSINTSAPINCLPPELHHAVFKEAVTPPGTVEHLDWRFVLTLTHVCQLWRTVAIAQAFLWSHIYWNTERKCVELFLQRTLNIPLVIHASLRDLDFLDSVLFNYGDRVGAVYIDHECNRFEQKPIRLLNGLSWSLPRLECFALKSFVGRFMEDNPLERRILAEDISPLKALCLDGITLSDWLSPSSFPNLTHLLFGPNSICNLSQLLTMLGTTPRLRYLHFTQLSLNLRFGPHPEAISHAALPLVSLPYIRILSTCFGQPEEALFLLRHLDLPAECAVCIHHGETFIRFSDPSPYLPINALDIPPLRVLDTTTSMDLTARFMGFLVAGHNAPHFSAGFFISMRCLIDRDGCWSWLAETLLPTFPLANITILRLKVDDGEQRVLELLPLQVLPHFTRLHELSLLLNARWSKLTRRRWNSPELVELFFGGLHPSQAAPGGNVLNATVCPELRILGLEVVLSHDDFPFLAVERMAAARRQAGFPLSRFVYHPHTVKYDAAEMRARFTASFARLATLVDEVEYRGAMDARACPFKSPRGVGCWDVSEAERYWKLPEYLTSYGVDPDPTQEGYDCETHDDIQEVYFDE